MPPPALSGPRRPVPRHAMYATVFILGLTTHALLQELPLHPTRPLTLLPLPRPPTRGNNVSSAGLCGDAAWQSAFDKKFIASKKLNERARALNQTETHWAPIITSTGFMQAADFVCASQADCGPSVVVLKRWLEHTPSKTVVVYVHSGPTLDVFLQSKLPVFERMGLKLVIVSGDGDKPTPAREHKQHLNNPALVGWFAQNLVYSHPKLHPLPIGLFYSRQLHGSIGRKLHLLAASRCSATTPKMDVLAAWKSDTNPGVRKALRDRVFGWPAARATVAENKVPLKTFFSQLVPQHRMVLSPKGNGIDCFRTWETLYLGRVPVVTTSNLDPLFSKLPVVILKTWEGVTLEHLAARYEEVVAGFAQPGRYNPRHLELDYHVCRIMVGAGRRRGSCE